MLKRSAARRLNPRTPARRGVVTVLAFLFLMLFSVLAVGFFAATSLNAQLSANDRAAATSQLAAESGMQLMRYQMACLDIPVDKTPDQVFGEVYNQLKAAFEGSGNLGSNTVGMSGGTISIPADSTGYIRVKPNGPGFRAVLTDAGETLPRKSRLLTVASPLFSNTITPLMVALPRKVTLLGDSM